MLSLEFLLHETWRNIRRNGLIGVAAASTVLVSLCFIGTFALLALNAALTLRAEQEKLDIQVFLRENIDPAVRRQLRGQMMNLASVQSVIFVSRGQALQELQQDFQGLDLSYLQKGGRNPLPESFRVKVLPLSEIPQVVTSVQKLAGVDEIVYGDRARLRLLSREKLVRAFMSFLGIALVAGSLIIIHNTIRLTVFARRQEIRIMQLVGATNWFIRGPFLLEGVFYGLLGGAAACVLTGTLYAYGVSYVRSVLGAQYLPASISDPYVMIRFHATLLLAGLAFGLSGSYVSMRRFLKPC